MASLFSGLWGGPALKYTLADEPYRQAWGCWTHYPATSKEDGSPASVFKLTASDPNDLKLVAARNGVKRLKLVGAARGAGRRRAAGRARCFAAAPQRNSHVGGAAPPSRRRHAFHRPARGRT